MVLATKTKEAIENAIYADQGAAFRENLRVLMPKMEDAYRGPSQPFRFHLGASLIGRECARQLWYMYHWCLKPVFPGRVLRLFNRGHLEEARFISMLQVINAKVWYETADGGQFKFSHHEGHFGSALDAVVQDIPDLPPNTPAYGEFKTMALKGFNKLCKQGVQENKPEHYAQIQMCMHSMGLPYGLYMVVCKDNDELHCEILTYDGPVSERYLFRAKQIIQDREPGNRISTRPDWYQCKYCDALDICHGTKVPEINCRTCLFASPAANRQWFCSRDLNEVINSTAAYQGCDDHVFNYAALNGVTFNGFIVGGPGVDLTLPNGSRILHGPNNLTSAELQLRGLA